MRRQHLRIGDDVLIRGRVWNKWRDSDLARRKGDDGQRVAIVLPSGAILNSVRPGDLARIGAEEPIEEPVAPG